ncbi:MAG: hypothetical protein AAF762_00800 [Pseudomonadota bacterium]
MVLLSFLLTSVIPTQAIFLQPDRLDPNLPGVGTNRYAYSGGDPINRADPAGEAFDDYGLDQDEADAFNTGRADSLDAAAARIEQSDNIFARALDLFGVDESLRRGAASFRARVGASVQERIELDARAVGNAVVQSLLAVRPSKTTPLSRQNPSSAKASIPVSAPARPGQVPASWSAAPNRKGVGTR